MARRRAKLMGLFGCRSVLRGGGVVGFVYIGVYVYGVYGKIRHEFIVVYSTYIAPSSRNRETKQFWTGLLPPPPALEISGSSV